MGRNPNRGFRALKLLGAETDPTNRELILKAGHKKLIKWFTLISNKILSNLIPMPGPSKTFMTKHKQVLQLIANKRTPLKEKNKLILTKGGTGFLGGVLIRTFMNWEEKKNNKRTPKKKNNKSKRIATGIYQQLTSTPIHKSTTPQTLNISPIHSISEESPYNSFYIRDQNVKPHNSSFQELLNDNSFILDNDNQNTVPIPPTKHVHFRF